MSEHSRPVDPSASRPRRPVRLLAVERLRLVEVPAPQPPPEERRAMDRLWNEAVSKNPTLFDGQVAMCAGLEEERPGHITLTWARATYRRYALRRARHATALLPSLFVAVLQPTDDGRLLLGRMASWTSAPGRWQPPGGSMEPAADGSVVDVAALGRHAARELTEETGLRAPATGLTPWCVTRGSSGNVGIVFLAPPRPESELREGFATMTYEERVAGSRPEFDAFALVRTGADLEDLGGPAAEYTAPLLRRYARLPPTAVGGP